MRPFLWYGVLIVASAALGIGLLLGGYLPDVLLGDRAEYAACDRFYTVWEHTCVGIRFEYKCFSVMQNTRPLNSTCWASIIITTFTERKEAEDYANSLRPSSFGCYIDPDDPCAYYDVLPDPGGYLIAGTVFMGIGAFIMAASIIHGIYRHCRTRGYHEIDDDHISVV